MKTSAICLFTRIAWFCILLILLGAAHKARANPDLEILQVGRGTANTVQWRPDGQVLAVGSGAGVWFYNQAFEVIGHFDDKTGYVTQVNWSPDGSRIMINHQYREFIQGQVWSVSQTSPILGKKLADIDATFEERNKMGWKSKNIAIILGVYYRIQTADLTTYPPTIINERCDT